MKKAPELHLQLTPVFQKNWEAIHKPCETCWGAGVINKVSCKWCGGSGKHYRYIIDEGSSRSSKTFSLIDCFDTYARTQLNKRLTVWRDTKKSCKDTVLNDTIKHFKVTNRWNSVSFNITDSIFKYPGTSSTFEIHGTDDETTVHGLTQDAAWLNEPYKISRAIMDQIDQRTSDFILIDWNPRLSHWIEDLKKDPRAIVIHSTFKDNPFCPPEQRKKILSYQPVSMCRIVTEKLLTEAQANSYDIVANPLDFSAGKLKELSRCKENEYKRSASEYNWAVYGLGLKAERPNRIFKFTEIPLSRYLELDVPEFVYSDWGAVDPWAVGKVKYYDGGLYIREINYESENIIRAKLSHTELEQIRGKDEGIVSWAFAKWGIPYATTIVCDTNRRMKILALREAGWEYAVGLTTKETGTGKTAVVDGIDLLNNMAVYFTSDSVNVKHEQENYSRKVDKFGAVLEEPEDFDNHHMDGIRYVAAFLQAEGVISKI